MTDGAPNPLPVQMPEQSAPRQVSDPDLTFVTFDAPSKVAASAGVMTDNLANRFEAAMVVLPIVSWRSPRIFESHAKITRKNQRIH